MAATISGFGSSINLFSLIEPLMAIERIPLNALGAQKSGLEMRNTIFSDLDSQLSALQTQAETLADTGSSSVFLGKLVTSSDTSVVTATAGSGAALGTHTISVTQLAKAHTMVSNQYTSSGTDIISALGAGTYDFSITIDGTATPVSVTLNAGDDNETVFNSIATAINDSSAEATASVLADTESTVKLVVQSADTGLTYKMDLADVTGTLLNTIAINDEAIAATSTTGGYIYADSELSAEFTFDGISITRDSNTISDLLTGLTINLLGLSEGGSSVTLTVSTDVETIKSAVEDFLGEFNETMNYLTAKTAVDGDLGTRGPLAGDYTYLSLRMSLRAILSGAVSSAASGNPSMLSEIGITAARDGTFSITDTEKFEDALADDPTKVADLFNSTDGVAIQGDDKIESFVKVGGVIDNKQDAISSKISSLDTMIERMEERLEKTEQRLTREFSALQKVLDGFTSQQGYLQMLYSSIYG